MQALQRAILLAGGQTALARRIGKTQSHVAQWLRRGRVAPTACLAIETAVGGRVTRYELRPDVFGPPPPPGDGKGTDDHEAGAGAIGPAPERVWLRGSR